MKIGITNLLHPKNQFQAPKALNLEADRSKITKIYQGIQ